MIDVNDSVSPFGSIERPVSAEEVSAILRASSESGRAVVPFGGKLSIGAGYPVDQSQATGLDLTGLSGVVSYEPADLTLSVNAGTSVAAIQAILGENGQELPIDCPHPDRATIGGLVATGFAGPRRLRSGSLRDLLIGCQFVQGDGMIASAGGLVVKNVSGFEIPRMLHGSWGALAVLTRVNLKVTPKPRADATIMVDSSLVDALDVSEGWLAQTSLLDACVVTGRVENATAMARVLGRASAVGDTVASLTGSLESQVDTETSGGAWQELVDRFAESGERAVLAFGCAPSGVRRLVQTLLDVTGGNPDIDWLVSPGTGSVRLTLPATELGRDLFDTIVRSGIEPDVVMTVECAPNEWKQGVDVWGVEPSGIDVMRDIKRAFDPAGILNPGRLFIQERA